MNKPNPHEVEYMVAPGGWWNGAGEYARVRATPGERSGHESVLLPITEATLRMEMERSSARPAERTRKPVVTVT